jgi:hypothetical protein
MRLFIILCNVFNCGTILLKIHNLILNQTLEKQIDQLVYKLYDLTPEEIAIVEGFNEGK